MTFRQALTTATARFVADPHLRDQAARDAELLLLHALQVSRVTLLAHPDRELTPGEQAVYEDTITRRLRHEPIQYITGQQEFYGLLLNVTPAVLIPRPETEHLVEAVLKLLPTNRPLKIADIGTGSGAIAIALAVHLPNAEIVALDISTEALAIAAANAREHDLADRIRFLQSDLLSALNDEAEAFDAVVSNPPYVAETDRATLHPQVRDHEPATALFAGETGLDIYRRLVSEAHNALKPNGLLALEIGYGQQQALIDLLANWREVSFIKDLQNVPRVVLAKRAVSLWRSDKILPRR
ncbi:MAG TPA: peptide chain release factor N(5)-glutamine methyltransferase [Edaphobacter sp.]|jgi:release factor glutamine methyltransferase|nr:peptide chain release factor N(5)-glutamine methyltransferase [Edaphobacter sp.]